jgi:hypothetical protein
MQLSSMLKLSAADERHVVSELRKPWEVLRGAGGSADFRVE